MALRKLKESRNHFEQLFQKNPAEIIPENNNQRHLKLYKEIEMANDLCLIF